MAGTGHKLWATGDLISAAAFNTYIQDQVVGVYADSSARDAAFGGGGEPTLAEGLVAFLKDTNILTVYSGSAWIEVLDIDLFNTSNIELNKDSGSAYIKLTSAHDTEATTPFLAFRKADGTVASPALVDDNAVLGTLSFQGYDGNSYATGARIKAVADGTPADGDMPTELIFQVTPDGGSETPATSQVLILASSHCSTQMALLMISRTLTGSAMEFNLLLVLASNTQEAERKFTWESRTPTAQGSHTHA